MPGSILDQAYEDKRNAELDAELDALVVDYDRRNPPPEPTPAKPAGDEGNAVEPAPAGNGGLEKLMAADDRAERNKHKPYSLGDNLSTLLSGDLGGYSYKKQISRELDRLYWERKVNGSAVTREDLIALAESNYAARQAETAQFLSDLPEVAKSGAAAFGAGIMSAVGMFGELVGDEEEAAEIYDQAGQLKKISEDLMPRTDNDELAGVYQGIRSFAMMAPAATLSWKTRNPEFTLGSMFAATGGLANLDAMNPVQIKGLSAEDMEDPEKVAAAFKTMTLGERLTYSVAQGLVERTTELLPAHVLFGSKSGRTMLNRLFLSLGAEIPGEQLAYAGQHFLEWRALNPTVPVEQYYANYPQQAYQTFIATITGTLLNNAGVVALDTADAQISKGLDKLKPKPGDPEGGDPAAEAAPEEGAAPAPEPAPDAQPKEGQAPAQEGEQASGITIGELADRANDFIEQLAESVKDPAAETEDQKFVRGVEEALGIKRPAAPVETPEQRRARMAERRAEEERITRESTDRVVQGVQDFARSREQAPDVGALKARSQQAIDRAAATESSEDIAAAVSAYNEYAGAVGREQIDPDNPNPEQTPAETEAPAAEPISLAEEMDIDLTDRTSSLAEAERMAAELEAMDSEDAAIAAMQFRTLVQYSDRYDDNTFWEGFNEALEAAAPHLMTETQQAAILEKVAEAVEDAPLAPEEQATATIVEEVRATAPASKYFGRKSFGGEGLATETPAQAAPVEQPAQEPAPQRVAPKGPAISEAQLAAITAKEQKTARKVVAREAMALKAEQVYDDVLSKDILEMLDDQFDMTERQVREVMGKAHDGQGSLDRFNTLMRRYAKVRAELDREAAKGEAQVQPDFEALAAAQPDPGEGGLGRGMQSLVAEQAAAPIERMKRFVEGETWGTLWKRVQRFAGREDAARRYDDAVQDAAIMVASMSPRAAEEALQDARQLGGPAEKAAVEDIKARVAEIKAQPDDVKFSANDDFYNNQEAKDRQHIDIVEGAGELLDYVTQLEAALQSSILDSNQAAGVAEPLQVIKQKLKEIAANKSARGREFERAIIEIQHAIADRMKAMIAAGQIPKSVEDAIAEQVEMSMQDIRRKYPNATEAELEEARKKSEEMVRGFEIESASRRENEDDVFENYGLLDNEDQAEAADTWREFANMFRAQAQELGLNDIVAKIEALGEFDQAAMFGDVNDNIQSLATVRRNIDELADEVFARARAAEDVNTPEWQTILDNLRGMVEKFEDEGGLRQYSRPRNVLFSAGQTSKRKPVKDPEKNRKRLDSRGYHDWGQNYLDLVQKGLVSYASAEEIAAMGLPGVDGSQNAYYIKNPDGSVEVLINTSYVRPDDLEFILLHEIGVHRGLRGLIGEAGVERVLSAVDKLVNDFIRKNSQGQRTTRAERDAYAARQRAIRNAARPEHVREETLAYIVEDFRTNPIALPFLTQMKVAIGRRFPGIISRLGWGPAEFAQLALVSMRRHIIKEMRHIPNNRAMPGNRSPRAPFLLEVTYPEGFRKLAREQGSATSPQGWARRMMTMGQKQMWRVIRTLDLRNVDTFPQQLKDMERDLTSPEMFEAFFHLDPDFQWENYLDLMYLAQQGDPDAAYQLYDILTPLKGLDVPVDIRYSANSWPRQHADGSEIKFDQVGNTVRVTSAHGDISGHIRQGAMIVSSSFVNPDQRGKGYGTDLYEAMAIEAANRGLIMFSDRNVSLSAARAWRSLAKRGFTIIENFVPGSDQVGDGGASPLGMNPFIALPPGVEMSFAEAHATMYPPAMREQFLEMADKMNEGATVHKGQRADLEIMFSADSQDTSAQPETDPALEDAYYQLYNWMRMGVTPEDPQKGFVLSALAGRTVQDRRGDPITLAGVRQAADEADAMQALVRSRKGEQLKPKEVVALRDMAHTSLNHLREVSQLVEDNPADQAALAALRFAARIHEVILAEAQGQMAEASRIMNSGRIVAKTSAGVAEALRVATQDGFTEGGLRRLAKAINSIDPTRPGAARKINRAIEITTWQAWKELAGSTFRFMFLSWLPTHMVNPMANGLVMMGSIADHFVAGLKPGQHDLIAEAQVRWHALFEAIYHQLEYARANSQLNPLEPNFSLNFDPVEASGVNKWGETPNRALSAYRLEKLTGGLVKTTPDDPIGRFAEWLGYGLAAPSDALGMVDDLFKGVNYMVAIRGLAFRQAREERRAGKITEAQERERAQQLSEFPPEDMVKAAIFEAQENTFTRPVGEMTQMALKTRSMADNLMFFGTMKMPFIITPSNLFSFAFRRMPTGPAFPEWRRNYAEGGKKRALAEAQFVLGSGMLMLGWGLWSMGQLTGSGPEDPEERKALMDTGWQPFAAYRDGTYVQTNRLDPVMMPFHIGALFAETVANDGWSARPDAEWYELWGLSAVKFGQMMMDKFYMSGLLNTIEALSGPGNAADRLARDYQNSLVSATTPAFLAGARRIEDPHKRLVDDMFSRFRNRMPVFSRTVPKAYDVLGSPVMYQQGMARAAQVINPFAITSVSDEPIYAELYRLKYVPSLMEKSISFPWGGNTHDISLQDYPEIYSEMTRLFGGDEEIGFPNYRAELNKIVESDGYKQLSDINDPSIEGSKAKAISDFMSSAREDIRKYIRMRYYTELKAEAVKQQEGHNKLAAQKEAEATQSLATEAYRQMVEEAK